MGSGLVHSYKGFQLGLLIIIGLLPSNVSGQQQLNYGELFGTDWQKAISYLNENDSWIRPSLEKYDIPYNEAVAVIFPELVRYSAIRDKMEITLLKTLYRNLGDDYADFSIGVFQVKPSFAEKIRSLTPEIMGKKTKLLFKKRSYYKYDHNYRAAIIIDLENPKTELNYLIAFFLICIDRFNPDQLNRESKIKFLATAYNTGFWKSKEDIINMEEKKFFNTKMFRTENYSYADVALYWYNNYSPAKNN
jgi:hypothetical protein